jgi:recombination protein RecA
MAAKKKEQVETLTSISDDFVQDLIKDLNREHQTRVAYNLATDASPTHVKRWISTGVLQLDYAISNRPNGGFPEGRIVEVFGPPSIGKSHLAAQVCKSAQRMGGIAVYIDTENAINPELLGDLGVNVSKRFIYADPNSIEDVFTLVESVVSKVKATNKDVPVAVIWDSVAATPAKAELEADYDQNSIGLAARQISKGLRKITQVIGNQNVLLVCLNQIRNKVGVLYGSPETTPGGLALPFHASVRIKLTGGKHIEDPKTKELVGIEVNANVIKDKVARPFRKCSFQIHFGKGIVEHEELFDELRAYCAEHTIEKNGKLLSLSGTAAWKELSVSDAVTGEILINKKFNKSNFDSLMKDTEYKEYIDAIIETALVRTAEAARKAQLDNVDVDPDGYQSLNNEDAI